MKLEIVSTVFPLRFEHGIFLFKEFKESRGLKTSLKQDKENENKISAVSVKAIKFRPGLKVVYMDVWGQKVDLNVIKSIRINEPGSRFVSLLWFDLSKMKYPPSICLNNELNNNCVSLFSVYPHGITILSPFGSDKKQVLNFCAQSAEELLKFVEDLKESIAEVSEMEQIRIECEF